MKNKIIIISLIILIIAGLIAIFLVFSKKSGDTVQYEGGSITVNAANGEKVSVNDFTKDATVYDNVVILSSDSSASIQFDKNTDNFQIVFGLSSIDEIIQQRESIENILISLLGVDKQIVCKLKVVEMIPHTENFNLPIYEFPLSFCPGGESLTKMKNNE